MRIDQIDLRELGFELHRFAQVVLGPAVVTECKLGRRTKLNTTKNPMALTMVVLLQTRTSIHVSAVSHFFFPIDSTSISLIPPINPNQLTRVLRMWEV
jgi:hypothetical protein